MFYVSHVNDHSPLRIRSRRHILSTLRVWLHILLWHLNEEYAITHINMASEAQMERKNLSLIKKPSVHTEMHYLEENQETAAME